MQATHLSYGSTGQAKSQEWRAYVPTAVVRDRQDYSYDSFGNLKTHKRTNGAQVATETMSYDALQRLSGTERTLCTGGLCTGAVTVSYGYEPNGNLSYKSDVTPAVSGSYTYGANGCGPHAASGVTLSAGGTQTYSCDSNGNVIGGSVFSATGAVYDFQNQARKVSRQSFGGLGDTTFEMATTSQRYREVRGTGETVLFGPGGFELVTAGGVTTYRHELGPIVVNTSGGTNTERYVLRDRLGSTTALSPPDQSISDRRAYDPYGKVRNGDFTDFGTGTLQLSGTTFRGFTSHEHVDNLQLIHMNGRLFDYHLGRFYQVDPVVQFPTNSQSLNPYSYLMNNPFAGTDPSGYCQKDLGSNICSQGDDVTLTATFSSGKTQNLGTYNTNKSKDIAQARGVKLGGNGVQSMSPTGAGGLKEQAAGAADKGAAKNAPNVGFGTSRVGGRGQLKELQRSLSDDEKESFKNVVGDAIDAAGAQLRDQMWKANEEGRYEDVYDYMQARNTLGNADVYFDLDNYGPNRDAMTFGVGSLSANSVAPKISELRVYKGAYEAYLFGSPAARGYKLDIPSGRVGIIQMITHESGHGVYWRNFSSPNTLRKDREFLADDWVRQVWNNQ